MMEYDYLKIIKKAAASVTDKNWCRQYWAIDDKGEAVKYNDEMACQWCGEGYILKAAHDLGYDIGVGTATIWILDHYLREHYDSNCLVHFNDKKAKSAGDIREMFLKAAETKLK